VRKRGRRRDKRWES